MKIFKKISGFIEKAGIKYIIISYTLMTVVTLIEVLRRYFLGLSYPWAEELVRFLLVTSTFVGASIGFKRGGLVALDILQHKLLDKNKEKLNVVTNLVILILLIALFKLGLDATFSRSVLTQKSPGLGIYMYIPYSFIPLSFLFMIFFSIENLLSNFINLKKQEVLK